MIKQTFHSILILAGLAAVGQPARAATLFQLNPTDGVISGAPGATVGWGFTITNTIDYINVTNSQFCEGAQTPPCTHAIGTYTDFVGPNSPVIGPAPESPTVTESFDSALTTGVGSFAINSNASSLNHAIGEIIFTYDVYTVSPNDPDFDPFSDLVSTGNVASLDATVNVIPEPATFALAGSVLAALAALRFRRLC